MFLIASNDDFNRQKKHVEYISVHLYLNNVIIAFCNRRFDDQKQFCDRERIFHIK